MTFKKRISAVNDNKPVAKESLRESYIRPYRQERHVLKAAGNRRNAKLQPGHMLWQPVSNVASSAETTSKPDNKSLETRQQKGFLRMLCLALFFASLFGLFGALLAEASNLSISAIAAFGSLCAAASLTLKQLNWRLREFLSVSLLSFLSMSAVMLSDLDLPSLTIPFALLALAVSFLTRTRLPAVIGLFGLIALAYLASPMEIAPLRFNELQGSVLTATLLFFIGLSHRLQSRSVMFLSMMSAYVWAAIWLFNSGINYTGIAGFAFIAMAAQYKLGKAGLDDDAFGSKALILSGWLIAFAAFLVLQWGFLSGENNTVLSVGKRPQTSMPWIIGSACAVACILVAGMTRHAKKMQSWASITISTVALAFVPFSVFRPDLSASWLSTIPNFDYIPGLGLIFAACGLTAAIIMIINGLRLNRQTYISMGLIGLGAQIVLLLQPDLLNFENIIVFSSALTVVFIASFFTLPSKAK